MSDAPPDTHFDVIVIGGGPAGYGAALYGSAAGLNIAVVEKDKVGGTCLHRGCIPAKELLETAHVFRTVSEAAKFGVESSAPSLAFATTMARKREVVTGLFNGLSGLLKNRKVTVFGATGTLQADRSVHLSSPDGDSQTITGDAVILASGSVPRTIPGFEVDGRTVLTSDEVFELEELPAKVAVIGGGAIGCEFASMLSDLGSEVTVLEALPQILNGAGEFFRFAVELVGRPDEVLAHAFIRRPVTRTERRKHRHDDASQQDAEPDERQDAQIVQPVLFAGLIHRAAPRCGARFKIGRAHV